MPRFNALIEPPFTYGSTGNPASTFEPAHPLVADTLCAVGRVVADNVEPVAEALVDPRVEFAAVIGFLALLWVITYAVPYARDFVSTLP